MPLSQHDAFDPYLEWLHIPISKRPPTYYDLLGLRPFESKIETIKQQAQARYRLVHQYQASRRGEVAVRVLAELAQARDVLCDPHRKAQYDAWLLAQGSAYGASPAEVPPHAESASVPPPLVSGSGPFPSATLLGAGPSELAAPTVSAAHVVPSAARPPGIAASATGPQGAETWPLQPLTPGQPYLSLQHPTLGPQPLLGQQLPPSQLPLPSPQPFASGNPISPDVPHTVAYVRRVGATPFAYDALQTTETGYAQATPQEVPAFLNTRNLVIAATTAIAITLLVAAWLLTRGTTPHTADAAHEQIEQQTVDQAAGSQPSAAVGRAGTSSSQPTSSQAASSQPTSSQSASSQAGWGQPSDGQSRQGQPAAVQPPTPPGSPPPGGAGVPLSQPAANPGEPPRTAGGRSLPGPPGPGDAAGVSEPNPWQQPVRMAWETPSRVEPLQVLSGNGTWPSTIAFSPNGKLLACGTRTGTVLVWTVMDGRLLFTLDAHVDAVAAMAFSPDGTLLATAGLTAFPADAKTLPANGQGLRFWRLKDGMLDRQILALPSQPIAIVFSADSRDLAAACADGTVAVWRVAKRQLLRRRNAKMGTFSCAAFSPDAQLLAACAGNAVRVWSAADGEVVFSHSPPFLVRGLAFNERGTELAIVCGDGRIDAWSRDGGGSERNYHFQQPITRNAQQGGPRAGQEKEEQGLRFAQFTPDGKLLLGADRTQLICWDGASGRLVAIVPGVSVEALAISPDGSRVACAHEDGDLSIWRLGSDGGLLLSSRHAAAITALARSTDGALLASASGEGMVCVWEAASGGPRATIPAVYEGGLPQALVFGSSGSKLAVLRSEELTFCDLKDGQIKGQPRAAEQQQVACSPDGGTLAVADKNSFSLLEGEALVPRIMYGLGETVIGRIAVAPGGVMVALSLVNGSEHSLHLRNVRTGKEQTLGRLTGPVSALGFSEDGRRLACAASGGRIQVYDVSRGPVLCTIDCQQDVRSLVFSPDGRTLACAAGRRVLLYGLPKGDSLGSIDAHSAPVTTMIFAPDGSWLASGGEDGLVRVWRPSGAGAAAAR